MCSWSLNCTWMEAGRRERVSRISPVPRKAKLLLPWIPPSAFSRTNGFHENFTLSFFLGGWVLYKHPNSFSNNKKIRLSEVRWAFSSMNIKTLPHVALKSANIFRVYSRRGGRCSKSPVFSSRAASHVSNCSPYYGSARGEPLRECVSSPNERLRGCFLRPCMKSILGRKTSSLARN